MTKMFSYSCLRKISRSIKGCMRVYSQAKSLLDRKHETDLDYSYLCDPKNTDLIEMIIKRKNTGSSLKAVISLWNKLAELHHSSEEQQSLKTRLEEEALKIPNMASPHLLQYGSEPVVIEFVNKKPDFDFEPQEHRDLLEKFHMLRTYKLGKLMGPKSYYLRDTLAEMEQALIRYTVSHLLSEGFTLISVPDLLYSDVIEACGMPTSGERTQVYHISDYGSKNVCLSGTAEMAIGGYLQNRQFTLDQLPLKLAAVSRCFRAEAGPVHDERGIYRVHSFTKVEMFGITSAESGKESEQMFQDMVEIQKKLFSPLGIHLQILDMPLNELGAPAYRKIDMEAWMPGMARYGEISSTTNCTDYQSRRLNIQYRSHNGTLKPAHTVNGTACAIPRCLLAICESHQQKNGNVKIPVILQSLMDGRTEVSYPKKYLKASWFGKAEVKDVV